MRALLTAAGEGASPSPGKGLVLPRTWDEQLVDYVRFLDQHNRAPSQYAEEPSERVLFYWLRNQRSSLRNGLLLPEKISKLNQALPGWSNVAPGGFRASARRQSSWNHRLEQLSEHWHRYGRNPVMGPSGSPEERALGKWLSAQRYALKKDTLYAERVAKLDELVPGWRGSRTKPQPLCREGGRLLEGERLPDPTSCGMPFQGVSNSAAGYSTA
jgi:hypothetical protein